MLKCCALKLDILQISIQQPILLEYVYYLDKDGWGNENGLPW